MPEEYFFGSPIVTTEDNKQSFSYDISEMNIVEKVQYTSQIISSYMKQCSKVLDCMWLQFAKDFGCCDIYEQKMRLSRVSNVKSKNGELYLTYYDKEKIINLACVNYVIITNDANYSLWNRVD